MNFINFSSQGNEKVPPLAKAKNSSDELNQVVQTAVPMFLCPKLLVESQVLTEQPAKLHEVMPDCVQHKQTSTWAYFQSSKYDEFVSQGQI